MFSVVIPTHNRLELLNQVIATIIRQHYNDFEVVIFDNASDDDIVGLVNSLKDERIRYFRSDNFLPVTDSWNQAIEYAKGDYITVLGDDDGLVPGYFSELLRHINQFEQPEIIYSAIYQFVHPGVLPWDPDGYVVDLKNGFFFREQQHPFLLSRDDALKAVNGSISFHRNFTFNIQAFVFSRTFLDRLTQEGPIFRSPFPDYYLANVALAKASSILVLPSPMSIAGVSKLSFGYTLFNNDEKTGADMLNTNLASDPYYKEIKERLINGPAYNTNYLVAMEHVEKCVSDFTTEKVNYKKYRRLQIYSLLEANTHIKYWFTQEGKMLWPLLTVREKSFAIYISFFLLLDRLTGRHGRIIFDVVKRKISLYNFTPVLKIIHRGVFSDVVELYDYIENDGK